MKKIVFFQNHKGEVSDTRSWDFNKENYYIIFDNFQDFYDNYCIANSYDRKTLVKFYFLQFGGEKISSYSQTTKAGVIINYCVVKFDGSNELFEFVESSDFSERIKQMFENRVGSIIAKKQGEYNNYWKS